MSRVSFVIPVYNCGSFLEECVRSIGAIGLEDYEIILVDDGSTDGSGALCDALAERLPEVCVFHQENQGVSAARNQGLSLARGEFVLFLDADDTIEPNSLGALLRTLEVHPEVDMAVFGLSFDYYRGGKCYRRDELTSPLSGAVPGAEWIRRMPELYAANALSPVWNKVVRRKVLAEHCLELRRDMFLYEDLEYSLRVMAHCGVIWFQPDVIYHYRQSEDEGNASRRLRRIPHIPDLLEPIEMALESVYAAHGAKGTQQAGNTILTSLHLVLAREKNDLATPGEIRTVCEDFRRWMVEKGAEAPENDVNYARMLMEGNVPAILARRTYIRLRHGLAVRLKSTGLYRRGS